MKIKLNSIFTAGLTAAALSAALVATTPAQAESRIFHHGKYGYAKYDGGATTHARKSFKRNRTALRRSKVDRRQNFITGKRKRTQIRIHR